MRRKAVSQAMACDGLAEPDLAARDPTSVLQCGDGDVIAGLPTGKQPQAGTDSLPRGAQNIKQTQRQHRGAILRALASFDVYKHAFAVDRSHFQPANLADAEAGRVGRRQRDPVPKSRNRLQEARDLLRRRNGRELVRLAAVDDPLERLLPAQRDAIEETQRASRLIYVRPRALLGDQMQLVRADILNTEPVRRFSKMAAEFSDRIDIRLLRRLRIVMSSIMRWRSGLVVAVEASCPERIDVTITSSQTDLRQLDLLNYCLVTTIRARKTPWHYTSWLAGFEATHRRAAKRCATRRCPLREGDDFGRVWCPRPRRKRLRPSAEPSRQFTCGSYRICANRGKVNRNM